MKTFNLTDKRIEALRWLARRDKPVLVGYLAEECFPRPAFSNGKVPGRGKQMATRAGAGYAHPMAEAGLVHCRPAEYGWGTVQITQEGRHVLAAFDRDDGSLEQWLAHARGLAKNKGYYWWSPRASLGRSVLRPRNAATGFGPGMALKNTAKS